MDRLSSGALLTLISLIVLLVMRAASDPSMAQAMPAIQAGLIVSGLLLLRQWRKARNAERASRAHSDYRSQSDRVTQLPNLEGFVEALARHHGNPRQGSSEVAVLCIGLSRLTDIYHRLGEACGDEALRELSGRLVHALGQEGVVGRIGEDTLAVFHPASGGLKRALLGREINRLMDAPISTPMGEMVVTSTIGVNFITCPVTAPGDALRQARLAHAAARSSGAPVGVFDASLDHAQKLQLDLEIELRRALQTGELQMVYQPQIDETGSMIGVEALMRWPHPTRGAVSPTVFVPLAEAAGLGEALGHYAMARSFAASGLWPGLKIAINVSPIQLRSSTFVDGVRSLLSHHGVKASGFELEITEGVLLQPDPTVLNNLDQLRRMGFQIALDDFGTGYSSLGYLSRLPIDKIKIDRSFVTPLGERKDAAMIIRAISDLTQAIGIKVLAEGVETHSQLDILRAEGCNQAQGYLIGRPMTSEQITALLHPPVATESGKRLAA